MAIFLFLFLFAAVVVLITLAVIDLRTMLLPNIWNGALAGLAVLFHALSGFAVLSPFDFALGALVGGGFLWVIRFGANWYYEQDALGLGDVKLLGAAGLWLGPHDILSAIVLGALFGLLHGICVFAYKHLQGEHTVSLSRLSIPAGPGFCLGIFAVGVWVYAPFVMEGF